MWGDVPVSKLLAKLPPYKGQKRTIVNRQTTFDIKKEILDNHQATMGHYDSIAADHWKGNVKDTARHLYHFLKANAPYKEETTRRQTTKPPAGILKTAFISGVDCKHYASYINGVGEALARQGKPVRCFYRFASYNNDRVPGHVFAVWLDDKGREVWIDPVPQISGFNSRNIVPTFYQDKTAPMSLYRMSGVGQVAPVSAENIIGGVHPDVIVAGLHRRHWLDDKPRHGDYLPFEDVMGKAHKKPHKAKSPHKKHGIHLKIKPGKLFTKFGLATARGAFLTLVKLNTFHLATKMWLKAAKQKGGNWNTLAAKWKNLGGNPDSLFKNIRQGVNTHNKLHPHAKINGIGEESEGYIHGVEDMAIPDTIGYYRDDMSIGEICNYVHNNHRHHVGMRHWADSGRMGVAQVAAAGIIAAAAPIIAALSNVLKSFGINTNKADGAADQDAENLGEKHNDEVDKGNANDNGEVTHDDGTVTKTTTDDQGNQQMEVKHIPGVKDTEGASDGSSGGGGSDGGSDDDGDDDSTTKTKTKSVTKHHAHGGVGEWWSNVTHFISEHKAPIIIVGAGTIGIIVLVKLLRHSGGKMKPSRWKK